MKCTSLRCDMLEADDFTLEAHDQEYLTAKVLLPNMGNVMKGKVTAGERDASNGNPIGWHHSNLILDAREYGVEFMDFREQVCQASHCLP